MSMYEEYFAQAANTLIDEQLSHLAFNVTEVATITDDKQKDLGYYTVDNGTIRYTAFSENHNYKVKDSVYVTIPNKDYEEEKIIIGKHDIEKDEKPYVYVSPFESFIDATGNLAENTNKVYELRATSKGKDLATNEEIPLRAVTDYSALQLNEWQPFTRIGLKARFKSCLPDTIHKGNYGLKITIAGEGENTDKNTPDGKTINITETTIKTFDETESLDVEHMLGDPYHLFTFTTQEIVLKIPEKIKKITNISLSFFEDGDFPEVSDSLIFDEEDIFSSFAGITNPEENNLFVKDIYLAVGYDAATINENNIKIFTTDNLEYKNEDIDNATDVEKTEALKRTVFCRWTNAETKPLMSVFNGSLPESLLLNHEQCNIISSSQKGYSEAFGGYIWNFNESIWGIKWYKQKLGVKAPDDYCGDHWEIVLPTKDMTTNAMNPFKYEFILDIGLYEERIKAIVFKDLTWETIKEGDKEIISFDGTPIISKELIFNNMSQINSTTSLQKTSDFVIIPDDGLSGQYHYYKLNNVIKNIQLSDQIRSLSLKLKNEPIDNSKRYRITWTLPVKNTMLNFLTRTVVLPEEYLSGLYLDIKDTEKIVTDVEVANEGYKLVKLLDKNHQEINFSWDNVTKKIKITESQKENEIAFQVFEKNCLDTKPTPYHKIAYTINSTFSQSLSNNIVKCTLCPLHDIIPYAATQEFNFGLYSSSGTRFSFYLTAERMIETGTESIVDDSVLVRFNGNKPIEQTFKITAHLRDSGSVNASFEPIDLSESTIVWSWMGGETSDRQLKEPLPESKIMTPTLNCLTIGKQKNNVCEINVLNNTFSNEIIDIFAFRNILRAELIWGSTKLQAFLPFAMTNQSSIVGAQGNFSIIYDSASKTPFDRETIPYRLEMLAKSPLKNEAIVWEATPIYYKVADGITVSEPFTPEEKERIKIALSSLSPIIDRKNILIPSRLFLMNNYDMLITATAIKINDDGKEVKTIVYSRPLITLQNHWPSEYINNWDGDLIIDKENNVLGASMLLAGYKDVETNTFTGVALGDMTPQRKVSGDESSFVVENSLTKTGVYGFNKGSQTYALKDDGTAFIGAGDAGRIEFDGSEGTIKSGGYDNGCGSNFNLKEANLEFKYPIQSNNIDILLEIQSFLSRPYKVTVSDKLQQLTETDFSADDETIMKNIISKFKNNYNIFFHTTKLRKSSIDETFINDLIDTDKLSIKSLRRFIKTPEDEQVVKLTCRSIQYLIQCYYTNYVNASELSVVSKFSNAIKNIKSYPDLIAELNPISIEILKYQTDNITRNSLLNIQSVYTDILARYQAFLDYQEMYNNFYNPLNSIGEECYHLPSNIPEKHKIIYAPPITYPLQKSREIKDDQGQLIDDSPYFYYAKTVFQNRAIDGYERGYKDLCESYKLYETYINQPCMKASEKIKYAFYGKKDGVIFCTNASHTGDNNQTWYEEYIPYYSKQEFLETIPQSYIVSLNGNIEKSDAKIFSAGPENNPQFSVDWAGNTLIKGNLHVTDDYGNPILIVDESHCELNVGEGGFHLSVKGKNLDETIDEIRADIDNTSLTISAINSDGGTYSTTCGKFDKKGLTIANTLSTVGTNMSPEAFVVAPITFKLSEDNIYKPTIQDNNYHIKINQDGVDGKRAKFSTSLNIAERMILKRYNDQYIGCFWTGSKSNAQEEKESENI